MTLKSLFLSFLLLIVPTVASPDSNSEKTSISQSTTISELLFSKKYNPKYRLQDSVMMVAVGKTNGQILGTGTAFLVDSKNGLLVTAFHVIQDGMTFNLTMSTDTVVVIKLPNDLGTTVADVVKVNPDRDLALLQLNSVDVSSIRSLQISEEIYAGQLAFVIGFPFSYGQMITCGVISSIDQVITIGSYKFQGVFYTDTIINPGNSGGPILNSKGQVIGIVQYANWIHRYGAGHPSKYILSFLKDQAIRK